MSEKKLKGKERGIERNVRGNVRSERMWREY